MMRGRRAWITALACSLLASGIACAQVGELAQAEELLKQKQYEPALNRVEAYLASRPKDARGRFLKAVILTGQNRAADAIRMFSELTGDYPELPEPYNNLAVLYAGQGDYDKARVALEMAVRANPGYAIAYENLGDIYTRMAGQAYDKAAKLDKANKAAPLKLKAVNEMLTAMPR
jgi:tetratricopeptide (TPR) repeat protein